MALVAPTVQAAITSFDLHGWDATIRYDLTEDGNVTDYSTHDYDQYIDCDASWEVTTNSTSDPVNSSHWIRYGLDYTLGEIGYEHQFNGTLEYRVYSCSGSFQITGLSNSGGLEGHAGWDVRTGIIGSSPVGGEIHDHHDTTTYDSPQHNHEQDGATHPWETAPYVGFNPNEYATWVSAHDRDHDPDQIGFELDVEVATDDAFPDYIPFSGQARSVVINHDDNRVVMVRTHVYLGGRSVITDGHTDDDQDWDAIRCVEFGGSDSNPEDCTWKETARNRGWPGGALGDQNLGVGAWGSGIQQTHQV